MNAAPELVEENALLKAELDAKNKQLQDKNHRIQILEEMLRLAKIKQFGSSSEKSDSPQHPLFNEAEDELIQPEESNVDEAESIDVPAHTRKKTKRLSIPEALEREEIIYDLSDEEKVCPHDGSALKHIGEETHEQLDVIPAQMKAIKHTRKKYACPCCDGYLVTAKKPKQPIEKSIASSGLLAYVATNKYADALPLYRQTEMFKRIGIALDRTSLANWMIKCGELIQPLLNRLQDQLLEQCVIHMDETPLQVLNEPGKAAQSKSYMWVMASPKNDTPVVLYHYSSSRSQDTPNILLAGYQEALMVDGYSGYQPVCDNEGITRLGCWAHARRYFVDAQKAQGSKTKNRKPGRAEKAINDIKKLYQVEARLRKTYHQKSGID